MTYTNAASLKGKTKALAKKHGLMVEEVCSVSSDDGIIFLLECSGRHRYLHAKVASIF